MWMSNFIRLIVVYLGVNAHGVVGGSLETAPRDPTSNGACSACARGACRAVNGIYTRPDLPAGYSLVAQVPTGACAVFVQQLKHTRNVLALKNANGSFILNGDWKFGSSRTVDDAGTKFTYVKQDTNSLETISAPGPLANAVDIMIVFYQANPGIKYGYSLPLTAEQQPAPVVSPVIAPPLIRRTVAEPSVETRRLDVPASFPYNISALSQKDEARPPTLHAGHRRTRTRRKYFHWKITGLTPCSKSCGGGTQTYARTCYRELGPQHQVAVSERRCAHLEAPPAAALRCNAESCPAAWEGRWGECSAGCGEGVQRYEAQCKQELAGGGTVIVPESQCSGPKPQSTTKPCRGTDCSNSINPLQAIENNELPQTDEVPDRSVKEWTVGPWSQCSVSCGTGHRTRQVTCPSGQCHPENRPMHAEYCNEDSCPPLSKSLTHLPEGGASPPGPSAPASQLSSSWLVTEWSHCSEACGTGSQMRLAACSQSECEPSSKPETSRACSSERECGGRWFAGPWGACADACRGQARQRRDVLCVVRIRGVAHVASDRTCPAHARPAAEQACQGACQPQWFTGDWAPCDCPAGSQRREVRCLDAAGRPTVACQEPDMPAARRPCPCGAGAGAVATTAAPPPGHDERHQQAAQDEPQDRSCSDKIRKCKLAVQARLCHYAYYKTHCCDSCRRALLQEPLE